MIHFEEYQNPKWWSQQRLRRDMLESVSPWILAALLFGAFAFAGWVDCAW